MREQLKGPLCDFLECTRVRGVPYTCLQIHTASDGYVRLQRALRSDKMRVATCSMLDAVRLAPVDTYTIPASVTTPTGWTTLRVRRSSTHFAAVFTLRTAAFSGVRTMSGYQRVPRWTRWT